MFFKRKIIFTLLISLFSTILSANSYDFNNDGKADILWRSTTGNYLWKMESNGTHVYKNIGGKALKYAIKGIADFNGDGISDILWKTKHYYSLWYMNIDGSHRFKYIGTKSKNYSVKAVADFNNDGIADILWRKDSENHLWYMNANGTHGFKNIGTKSKTYSLVGVEDFNNDGITDILWRKGSGNYLWYMNSNGTHRYKNIGTKSERYLLMAVADFNNDGVADILWRRGSGNYLWYMNSNGTHRYKNIGTKSTIYSIEGVADFNGDNNSDILWKQGNYYSLWNMRSNGTHQYKYIGSKSQIYNISNKVALVEHSTVYEDAEHNVSSNWVQVLSGHYNPLRVESGFHSDGTLVLTPEWINHTTNISEYHLDMNNSKQKILEMDMGGLSNYRLPNLTDIGYIPHYQVGVYVQTTNGRRAMAWDSFFNHGNVEPFSTNYGDGNIWLSYPSPVEHVRGYPESQGIPIDRWKHFRVNVEKELQKLEPNNKIISIDTFLATGGFIDNLKLSSY